ncbi:MAG: hypothetical protein ACRCXZ_06960 [Patescibacteria group bacterium]
MPKEQPPINNEDANDIGKNTPDSDSKRKKTLVQKIFPFAMAWNVLWMSHTGYTIADKTYKAYEKGQAETEQLARTGNVEELKERCFKNDKIYRIKNTPTTSSLEVISDFDYNKLSNSIAFDTNYDKTKLKELIDDIQVTLNLKIELKFDEKNKTLQPVQNLVDQLVTLKTTLTSYGQRSTINRLIIHNGEMNVNPHVKGAGGYFFQDKDIAIGISLQMSGIEHVQQMITHELHHFEYARDYKSARLCKMYIEFNSAGISDDGFKVFFAKLQDLEKDSSIIVNKIKQDFEKKDPKAVTLTFENQMADFDFVYDNYIRKELFPEENLPFKNYYIYFGLKDLVLNIVSEVYNQTPTPILQKHGIKNKPNFAEVSQADSIADVLNNDETQTVSAELQAFNPEDEKINLFVNSLIVTGGKFNNSRYYSPEYLKLKLEYNRLNSQLVTTAQVERAPIQNQIWELSKQMEQALLTKKSEFSIQDFLKIKPKLIQLIKEDIAQVELKKFNDKVSDLKIEKYYQELNLESINPASKAALEASVKKEDMDQIEKEIIEFQKESGVFLNFVNTSKETKEKFSLLVIRTVIHHLKTDLVFNQHFSKGDVINLHLDFLNHMAYSIKNKGQRTLGLSVANSVFKTYSFEIKSYSDFELFTQDSIRNENLKNISLLIKNYDDKASIKEQMNKAISTEIADPRIFEDILKTESFNYDLSIDIQKPEKQLYSSMIQAARGNNSNFFDPEYIKLRAEYSNLRSVLDDFYTPRSNEASERILKDIEEKLNQIKKWHQKPAKPFSISIIEQNFEANKKIIIETEKRDNNFEFYLEN